MVGWGYTDLNLFAVERLVNNLEFDDVVIKIISCDLALTKLLAVRSQSEAKALGVIVLFACVHHCWLLDAGVDGEGSGEVSSRHIELVLDQISLCLHQVSSSQGFNFVRLQAPIFVVESF